jgi:hypothetical protein
LCPLRILSPRNSKRNLLSGHLIGQRFYIKGRIGGKVPKGVFEFWSSKRQRRHKANKSKTTKIYLPHPHPSPPTPRYIYIVLPDLTAKGDDW